ncbi:hypothetical protein Tsubulata_025713 [Turnera subulata]|uniref:Uncharacterized protein n=1 Tax=Turnera subulata TaxID=218843 RepID=A0A9Q0FQY2_9ROSI|nr:hypothetical protein Tsubulata_025713 [Turnera subulata]
MPTLTLKQNSHRLPVPNAPNASSPSSASPPLPPPSLLQGLTTTSVAPSTHSPPLNSTLRSCRNLILTLGTTVLRLTSSTSHSPRPRAWSLHSRNPSPNTAECQQRVRLTLNKTVQQAKREVHLIQKAALKGIDWTYKSDEKAIPKRGVGNPVQIVQRHHFASHLKRMSVVVRIEEEFFAFVKGAPETIQDMLTELPPSFVETYKKYTRQGSRVLALAFKSLPDMTVMITGDQALTACHVANQVHVISKPALILGPSRSGEGYEWISPDETEKFQYRKFLFLFYGLTIGNIIHTSEKEAEVLSETYDLFIGGDCIEMLQQS